MAEGRALGLDLARLLVAVENAPPVAAADVLGEWLEESLGAFDVSFLVADFSGRALIRLGHAGVRAGGRAQGRETAERVPLEGSAHGRALRDQTVDVELLGDEARLIAPVTNRGEAIGVLELVLSAPPDEQTLADVALAAHALAYVIIANRRFTDLFEWGQRSVRLSLAAEIQHRLLPGAFTCEGGQFTLAAWLEPAGEIAGDSFDFALERDTLHLSMTDAMGHDVHAAMLATLVVGALRNARRAGAGLLEQARNADASLAGYADRRGYVTGQVARVNLQTGTATVVNAGHPHPLRLRDGRVDSIDLVADPAFGLYPGHEYRVQPLPLQAGDRLMFITDGVLERNAASLNLEALIIEGAEMHPREAVQHVVLALLHATEGRLKDDATAMCVDWHGGPPRERTTDSGAND
ncbi:MAG: PP2C family protein-serine/threonine phosphatase [Solirubrobacteraceae bacterium]